MNLDGQPQAAPAALDPPPLRVVSRNWTRWVGPTISILVLCAVLYQLRSLDLVALWRMLPVRLDFWLAVIVAFLSAPVADWLIFRHLWGLPALSGIAALTRKMVSNELLLGYSGEVYFYAWVRRNSTITSAPFGAIKDVTILSALAGNVVTLVLVLLCWPFFSLLHVKHQGQGIEWSILFVLAMSVAITFFRKRLFSLPARDLWYVTAIHLARIFISTLLLGYIWYCLMPDIGLVWLLMISTMRLLLSRLPFLPNKDLAFAALAAFFIGHDNVLVGAMTLTAGVFLACLVISGAILGVLDLLKEGQSST